MNKEQFLSKLEQLLERIPEADRREALQYYRDYFDDAGPENEAKILEELESPEKVAASIRAGAADGSAEYTESGYQDARFRDNRMSPEYYKKNGFQDAGPSAQADGENRPIKRKERKGIDLWKLLAIVLLAILLAPILLPAGIGVLGVIAGIIICILALCFGIGIAGVVLFIAGVFVIGYGIVRLIAAPAIGLATAGLGFILLAIGILVSLIVLWIGLKVVPVLIRGIVNFLSHLFRKGGKKV